MCVGDGFRHARQIANSSGGNAWGRTHAAVDRIGLVRMAVRAVLGLASLSARTAQHRSRRRKRLEEVVVTGFRQSLSVALDEKRAAVGAVDAIVAEDIADFPDLNLAESIQRVPGVSIARDAGEGRQISVRGLGPQFTRVRINGMEAMSANGGTDAAGGTNRDRSFDFNTFASELFNSITMRKTSAADIEEGSLGATVDLRSARPFDYDGFTVVTSVQGSYNDISEDVDPRGALLISNTFADGKFGALLSVAYTERKLLDEGSSTVRWQDSRTRTARQRASRVRPARPSYPATPTLAQLNAAFRPRIPRYDIYEHEQERLGITGSLQWQAARRHAAQPRRAVREVRRRAQRDLPRSAGVQHQRRGRHQQRRRARRRRSTPPTRSSTACSTTSTSAPKRASTSCETEFTHVTLDGTHEFTDTLRAARAGRLLRGRARQSDPDDAAVRSRRRRRLQLRLPRQQPPAA